MFNAANILEALKNYIHTRGGTSNAYNIAEAVNDLNSIPQGSSGDIPDEVSNAIETHGMGWTDEEEVVHQIDQKYIPQSSGGAMVVNFNVQVSGDEGVVSADKTPAEVIAAAITGPVMGTLISSGLGITEISPLGSVVFIDPSSPAFWAMSIKNNKMHYLISAEDDNWVVSFM